MANTAPARIFREAKNPMQSGRARTGRWVLVFQAPHGVRNDPLTGWAGSGETQAQVRLVFETEAEACAYCDKNGIAYEVEQPQDRSLKIQAYADNFR